MLNSVASKGNYVVKSDGSHNGLIPAAVIVNTTPNIILYGSNLLHNVFHNTVKMMRYQRTEIYLLKTDKNQCSKYTWHRVAKSTESYKLKNIAHSDETAYNDYK